MICLDGGIDASGAEKMTEREPLGLTSISGIQAYRFSRASCPMRRLARERIQDFGASGDFHDVLFLIVRNQLFRTYPARMPRLLNETSVGTVQARCGCHFGTNAPTSHSQRLANLAFAGSHGSERECLIRYHRAVMAPMARPNTIKISITVKSIFVTSLSR